MLGAYMFVTLETGIRMLVRCFDTDEYSPWQRHLYAIWSVLMFFIAAQLVWDANVYYYPQLDWHCPQHLVIQDVTIMSVPLCGMVLWSMTTHRILSAGRMALHLVPFVVIITVECIVRAVTGWNGLVVVLYVYTVCYCLYLLRMFIKNARDYNRRLLQTYADTKYRTLTWMIHLIWLMAVLFALYLYFGYFLPDMDYIYYGIACAIFYFITWNLIHARETNVLEEGILEEEQELEKQTEEPANNEVNEEQQQRAEQARQSLRELTRQRLEDTLEDTCVKRRLYLNPDLTVMDLANELNTNRTYVSQYFSEHHTTFLKYINDLRVEYAMYQLKNTNHKVADVMFDSGFRHAETFRRAFQNRYNMDPREVQRKPAV